MKGVDVAPQADSNGMWYVLIAGKAVMFNAAPIDGDHHQNKESEVNSLGYCTLGPGDIFGAYPVLVPGSLRSWVQAASTCTLVSLPLDELEMLKDTDPQAAERIAQMSSDADFTQALAQKSRPTKDGSGRDTKEESMRSARAGTAQRSLMASGDYSSLSSLSSFCSPSVDNIPNLDGSSHHRGRLNRGMVASKHRDKERMLLWEAAGLPSSGHGNKFSTPSLTQKISQDSHAETKGVPLSEMERYTIKNSLIIIQDAWSLMSMGNTHISFSLLSSVEKDVGEAGSELFKALFNGNDSKRQISEDAFWKYWVQFFEKAEGEPTSKGGGGADDHSQHDSAFDGSEGRDDRRETDDGVNDDHDVTVPDNSQGWLDLLSSIVSPARSIKHLLFAEDTMGRYEDTYIEIAGDLKVPISSEHLSQFLMVLLPEYKYNISARNVKELLEAFGKDSGKTTKKSMNWSGIRKGLEEYKSRLDEGETDILIGSAFNSSSAPYRDWVKFVTFVAVYHFIMVIFPFAAFML